MHSFSTAKLANFLELSTIRCKKKEKKGFFNTPPIPRQSLFGSHTKRGHLHAGEKGQLYLPMQVR